jgi:hypothetical protein
LCGEQQEDIANEHNKKVERAEDVRAREQDRSRTREIGLSSREK